MHKKVSTESSVITDLQLLKSDQKAAQLQRYFKTGPGQYAEGDVFWGINVPAIRTIARAHQHTDVAQLEKLLEHDVHEVRMCTLLIMVLQAKKSPEAMYNLYLAKTANINNWDLVDLSAPIIVGNFLIGTDCSILYQLAQSKLMWERRIAIVATFALIKQGQPEHTLNIAKLLLADSQDLLHKATGWMLREVGKRCSMCILENFLEEHAATMPRTMLRYAIEHMSCEKRTYFMHYKRRSAVC